MENTFELTDLHTDVLNSMNDELKGAIAAVVNAVGYYQAISFFMTKLEMSEKEAKIFADLGCYVLEGYE